MKNYADRGGCFRSCLEDKGLFRSANILQVADAVRRVVFNKKNFLALWASVWSKNKGRPEPPDPSPGSTTALNLSIVKYTHCLGIKVGKIESI